MFTISRKTLGFLRTTPANLYKLAPKGFQKTRKKLFREIKEIYELEKPYRLLLNQYYPAHSQTFKQLKKSIDIAIPTGKSQLTISTYVDKNKQVPLKVTFTRNLEMIVDAGYRWDGNSPKILLFNSLIVGTYDGDLMSDGKPRTYEASMIHDVLGSLAQSKRAQNQLPSFFTSRRQVSIYEVIWKGRLLPRASLSSMILNRIKVPRRFEGRHHRDCLYTALLENTEFEHSSTYYWGLVLGGPLYEVRGSLCYILPFIFLVLLFSLLSFSM